MFESVNSLRSLKCKPCLCYRFCLASFVGKTKVESRQTEVNLLDVCAVANFLIAVGSIYIISALRESAANDNLFKVFFLHLLFASKLYNNTFKTKIAIG